ncbi:Uma2 family endonuclease [Cronbergia sp. UHCC 0137]|uniref:Uma2 family endonuclease n=1 Tax=Cronbergia sp. UHCC 0137 TaxID=3110239 RepID=UPI002B213FA0|nr:Uma2 family endonuclease [Cronbergia sp. UHCC 0137]MEA5619054.1 Uma2 family endonuclease [Cronbergia sp. UHCC 0137]
MITVPYNLPTAEDLPDGDETPVDNELQNDIPNILLNILKWIWNSREDWFWGVDMCIYYEPNIEEPIKSKSIVPDGFLALGVERLKNEGGRLSYVLWQEQVLPILVLEVVSHKYNGEYDDKLQEYQNLGILYYVIYNPLSGRRGLYKKHQSLEVYKLIDRKYELIPAISKLAENGKMFWMPEVGLGIGCERGNSGKWEREWVYWYDRSGVRYPTAEERATSAEERATSAEERAKSAEERAELERTAKEQAEIAVREASRIALQERQEKEKLAAYLKSLNINPDEI